MSYVYNHDMGVVAEVADRVIVMFRGQKEEGDAIEIFHNPKHPYTSIVISCSKIRKHERYKITAKFSNVDINRLRVKK